MKIKRQLELPSPWVTKHGLLIREGGHVLDLACGVGRHAIWLAEKGYQVDAVDCNQQLLAELEGIPNITTIWADIEAGEWPSNGNHYDGIIVSRYLYRQILEVLAKLLKLGGVLIYETFMVGNERYGKPSNPDYLLLQDELNMVYSPLLHIHAFEQGEAGSPARSVMQRICATKTHDFK